MVVLSALFIDKAWFLLFQITMCSPCLLAITTCKSSYSSFAQFFSSSSPNLPKVHGLFVVSHIEKTSAVPGATSTSPWRPWSAFAAMEAANLRAPTHWFPTWRTWRIWHWWGATSWVSGWARAYFSIGKWGENMDVFDGHLSSNTTRPREIMEIMEIFYRITNLKSWESAFVRVLQSW